MQGTGIFAKGVFVQTDRMRNEIVIVAELKSSFCKIPTANFRARPHLVALQH